MARVNPETKKLTRQRLLDAGADEFARNGLLGANVNRISVAAGLAKGTIYNYFTSKEELFLAVCLEACARAAAGARALPPEAPTRERLRALVESDVRWAREHDAFARVLIREALSGDSRFAPQVLEAAAPWFAKLTEVLDAGVERGEIRRDVPIDQLALSATGLINLALVQHWGSSGAWPSFDDIPDIVLRQFLEGAQPKSRIKPRQSPATPKRRGK